MSAPTINDLRVKECYICRDEEYYDAPENPPRAWVHPCKCTLIAHQSCLMESILKSRRDSSARCPQCGYKYQIERKLPLLASTLVFKIGDIVLQAAGMGFFVTSLVGLGTVAVGSLFAVGTGYGAVAVREFFGKELFDFLLTEEPSNWSWIHFLMFPLTPPRLTSGSFESSFDSLGGFLPFFFCWPSIPPESVRAQLIAESSRIDYVTPSSTLISSSSLSSYLLFSSWPPSIKTFGYLVAGTTILYNYFFPRFAYWLLGASPPKRVGLFSGIRMRREIRRQQGPNGEEEREAILQIEHRPEEPEVQQREGEGVGGGDALEALEGVTQYVNISVAVGLLKPFVASGMGKLLYAAAQYSSPLRYFLGIRAPSEMMRLGSPPRIVPELLGGNMLDSAHQWYWRYFTEQAVQSMDPVWIRNSIGLGIFVVAKDCIHLLHLWLTKRELASRKLKNRDFSGVDPKELDLIQPRT